MLKYFLATELDYYWSIIFSFEDYIVLHECGGPAGRPASEGHEATEINFTNEPDWLHLYT